MNTKLQRLDEIADKLGPDEDPWKLVTWVAFSDEQKKARTFERYLKSGSGHAFAKKRLW